MGKEKKKKLWYFFNYFKKTLSPLFRRKKKKVWIGEGHTIRQEKKAPHPPHHPARLCTNFQYNYKYDHDEEIKGGASFPIQVHELIVSHAWA